MPDAGCEMIREAGSLDPLDDEMGNASFDVLTSLHVFALFIAVNPSIIEVIRMKQKKRETANANLFSASAAAPSFAPSTSSATPPPDPYGNHLDPDFFRKPSAPKYAKGSAAHRDGEYNLFGY